MTAQVSNTIVCSEANSLNCPQWICPGYVMLKIYLDGTSHLVSVAVAKGKTTVCSTKSTTCENEYIMVNVPNEILDLSLCVSLFPRFSSVIHEFNTSRRKGASLLHSTIQAGPSGRSVVQSSLQFAHKLTKEPSV